MMTARRSNQNAGYINVRTDLPLYPLWPLDWQSSGEWTCTNGRMHRMRGLKQHEIQMFEMIIINSDIMAARLKIGWRMHEAGNECLIFTPMQNEMLNVKRHYILILNGSHTERQVLNKLYSKKRIVSIVCHGGI
jgi:hypothetical protein